MPFGEILFGTITNTSDADFLLGESSWDGCWVPPSVGKIVFNRQALSYINENLNRIHIPTWIRRAIPVLGKASFGRLKADEWRNLFTIQLPLILPVFWNDDQPGNQSLLHNFAHLVSLVNIALKRTMNQDRIEKYRYHLYEYIKSSLVLFPESNLAPNHHMAFHLADCLERFGPCRAWWSFSMERLMGSVLKASTNNHLGELVARQIFIKMTHFRQNMLIPASHWAGDLEITCLSNFYWLANLRALLDSPTFPEELEPLIRQVKSLHNPIPFVAKTSNLKQVKVLDKYLFASLIIKINELFPLPDRKWIAADKWDKLKSKEVDQFAVVNSRITEISNVSIDGTDVMFSTFEKNANNSIIVLKPTVRAANYGIIKHIFKHSRIAPDKTSHTDTWFAIKPLVPVPNSDHPQPFEQLEIYEVGLRLRRLEFTGQKYIIVHSNEILAHCAWMKYGAMQINQSMDYETFALVSLDR
ncbi:hypothetical protein MJO29_012380 [Puccinia striiformis f. sp. tritici]|nr:hypothetical protein MJO29_012380 [Puccinia striiformis f. sp. tritici]